MAEPKPTPEKPNLVAVPSERKDEARPEASQPSAAAAGSQPAKAAPTLGRATPAPAPREEKRQGTRWVLWLLALLALVAGVTAWAQTERLSQAQSRVTALSEQVLGLEAQLSVANTQIQTYEMQRGQVREAVSDIAERVLLLSELVGGSVVGGAGELPPPTEPDAIPE